MIQVKKIDGITVDEVINNLNAWLIEEGDNIQVVEPQRTLTNINYEWKKDANNNSYEVRYILVPYEINVS